ncbi:13935_t:CDS:2, partial [Acaulospora colombiana]
RGQRKLETGGHSKLSGSSYWQLKDLFQTYNVHHDFVDERLQLGSEISNVKNFLPYDCWFCMGTGTAIPTETVCRPVNSDPWTRRIALTMRIFRPGTLNNNADSISIAYRIVWSICYGITLMKW